MIKQTSNVKHQCMYRVVDIHVYLQLCSEGSLYSTPQSELVSAKIKILPKGWMFPLTKIYFLVHLTLLRVSSSSLLSFQFHGLFYCKSSSCNVCGTYCFAFALPSVSLFTPCYHNHKHKHTHTHTLPPNWRSCVWCGVWHGFKKDSLRIELTDTLTWYRFPLNSRQSTI